MRAKADASDAMIAELNAKVQAADADVAAAKERATAAEAATAAVSRAARTRPRRMDRRPPVMDAGTWR